MLDITCECGRNHREIIEQCDEVGVYAWVVVTHCTMCLEESTLNQTDMCTVCHSVPVDTANGFDTCDSCLSKI